MHMILDFYRKNCVCNFFAIFVARLQEAARRSPGVRHICPLCMRQPVRCAGMEICQCSSNLKIVSL